MCEDELCNKERNLHKLNNNIDFTLDVPLTLFVI